jgi:CBS domain-containing protein
LDKKDIFNIVFAHSSDSVRECARKMRLHNVGSLVVRDNEGHTIGILTERDFVRSIVEDDIPIQKRNVKEIMTPVAKLICVSPDTERDELIEMMQKHQIRHLPVKEDEMIIGMLSIRDLLDSFT